MKIDEARLRKLAEQATPGPWFWNSYSAIFSEPLQRDYQRQEDLIPDDAGDDDPRWADLPETVVCYVAQSRPPHGDLPSRQGALDAQYIEAVSPTVVLALLDELDRLRGG